MALYYKSFINSIDSQIKLAHKNLIWLLSGNNPITRDRFYMNSGYFHTPLESQCEIYDVRLFIYENSSIIAPEIDLSIQCCTFRKFKSFPTENIWTLLEGGEAEKISCKKKKYILKLGSTSKSIRFTPTRLKRFL